MPQTPPIASANKRPAPPVPLPGNANLPRRTAAVRPPPPANINLPRRGMLAQGKESTIQSKPASAFVPVRAPQPPARVLQKAATHLDGNGAFITARGDAPDNYGWRQLHMRAVSTALRKTMHYSGGGTLRVVNIFNITLLHGWNTGDTKTAERIKALEGFGLVAAHNTAQNPLTADQIATVFKSGEEIQIVERANLPDNYVTLQGVGRLAAIRQWLQSKGVTANFYVQVMCYPASGSGADNLVDISHSYDAQESFVSRKVIGPAIYIGSTVATAGALAFAAWRGFKRLRGG